MISFLEQFIKSAGAIAGLTTLSIAIFHMIKSLKQPSGRQEPGARYALRIPVLIPATILFILAGILLWRPLPVNFSLWLNIISLIFGSILLFSGLAIYLWGLFTLGRMFGPSSGFGVRLQANHKLITNGPYSYIRHPMYFAVCMSANGGMLIYKTWTMFFFAIIMFGLIIRSRREEKVLAKEFGVEWAKYKARVPAWFPRLKQSLKKSNKL